MRDGRLRRTIKAVARWNHQFHLGIYRRWRRLRGERPYRLAGACRGCAACCEAPSIRVPRLLWYLPAVRAGFLWWQEHVNGFLPIGVERPRTFVFRCSHFDPATRRCDSYESRPAMCRDYPREHLWQVDPELFPGCGYRPLAAGAEALRRALEAQDLTPEQRRELSARLHLE